MLVKPDQIDVNGNHIIAREEIQKLFVHDRDRSVLRIPLEARRSQIQEIPWVEEASVQRILPNRLRVEITERTPVAFFRKRRRTHVDRWAWRSSGTSRRRRLSFPDCHRHV